MATEAQFARLMAQFQLVRAQLDAYQAALQLIFEEPAMREKGLARLKTLEAVMATAPVGEGERERFLEVFRGIVERQTSS